MKRFLLGLALVVGLASASIVSAADLSSYATGARATQKGPAPTMTMAAAPMAASGAKRIGYYPTDITIYNDSPYFLYFTLPGSGIENPIPPNGYGYVTHPYAYSPVRIMIQDEHLYPLWEGVVCPQSEITVTSNMWGERFVRVDSFGCY